MTIPKIRAWDPELCLMVPDHFLKRTISGSVYEVISPLTGDRLPIAKALYPNNVMQSFHVLITQKIRLRFMKVTLFNLRITTLN